MKRFGLTLLMLLTAAGASAHDAGARFGQPTNPGETLEVLVTSPDGITYWFHFPRGLEAGTHQISAEARLPNGLTTPARIEVVVPSIACTYDANGDGLVLGNDHLFWYLNWRQHINTACTYAPKVGEVE